MKNKTIILALLLFAFAAEAQNYSFRKVEELGEYIPKACIPPDDSVFYCSQIIQNKPLVVRYNGKREIEHLGVSLFSNETKAMISLPVCNFIERTMLELVLQKTKNDVTDILKYHNMQLKKNGGDYGNRLFSSLNGVLEGIKKPVQFDLNKANGFYTALWQYGENENLSFSFPVSRSLIFGTDKKESDEVLNDNLSRAGKKRCTDSLRLPDILNGNMALVADKGIFIKRGKSFIIKTLNTDTYYSKTEGVYRLLFSREFPCESLSNLIVANAGQHELKLHVTHRMYGHFTPDFDMDMDDFFCFFRNDFDIYTAFPEIKQGMLKLTVALHNRDFNYIHLLLINTAVDRIFETGGILNADFYSNIPQHNIKSLFAEQN